MSAARSTCRAAGCEGARKAAVAPECSAACHLAGPARHQPPRAPRSPQPAAARGTCGRSAARGSCPNRTRCTASLPPRARLTVPARRRSVRRSLHAWAAPGRRTRLVGHRSQGGRHSQGERRRQPGARRGHRPRPSGSAEQCRGWGCRTCSTGGGSGSGRPTGMRRCARTAGQGAGQGRRMPGTLYALQGGQHIQPASLLPATYGESSNQ